MTIVPLPIAQALPSLKAGQIDAVALVSPPAGTVASDFVRALAKDYAGKVGFVPVDTAEAIAEHIRTVLSPARFREHLADPAHRVVLAEVGARAVGYTMVVQAPPADADVAGALRLRPERMPEPRAPLGTNCSLWEPADAG